MSSDASIHRHGQGPVRFLGDLTPDQQTNIVKFADLILRGRAKFAETVGLRLELTEVSVFKRLEDEKLHAVLVFEIDTAEDMLNAGGNIHGGCTMFMIDVCSSIAMTALSISMNKRIHLVSQAINTVFHAPISVGARLQIVNRTIAYGARTVSARTEIWDVTNRRLIATGVHNQMQPSPPKL